MPCASEKVEPAESERIVDWSSIHPYTPDVIYDPVDRAELVAAVIEGERTGGGVRAQGACYSLSRAAVADRVLIRTTALNKFLGTPGGKGGKVPPPETGMGDPCDTPALAGSRIRTGHEENVLVLREGAGPQEGATLIHVEAGVRIRQLLRDLAAIGLALPTMGSGGCQTLAGAISTGTHNSDARAPLVDDVRAIHLVGPGGQEWWIEPSAGLLAPGALLAMRGVCDDIRIVRDDDFFRAAMVSAGRFGVIYAVVLEVPAQYKLEEKSRSDQWSLVSNGLRQEARFGDGGPPGDAHFNQYALDLGGRDKVWITTRRKTTKADENIEPPSAGIIGDLCKSPGHLAPLIVAMTEPFLGLKLQVAPVPVMGLVWSANIDALHIKLADAVHTSETIGDFMAFAVEEINSLTEEHVGFVATELVAIVKHMIEGIFDGEFTERRVGPSQKLLDTHNYKRDGCLSANSTELFFDASKTGYLDFVNDVRKAAKADGFLAGYASLRFVRGSKALLAPERWSHSVAIEIAAPRSTTTGDLYGKFFKRVHALARKHGAIPHWGQELRLDPELLEQLYGEDLQTWRWALSELEGGGDPTFSSDFTRDCGLEDGGRTVDEHRDARTGGVLVSALMAHAVV